MSPFIKFVKFIKNYIDTYPQLVARYFFGEVKKQQTNGAADLNDNLECGTCGAGVPYVGKVMNLLIDLKKSHLIVYSIIFKGSKKL